MEVRKEFIWWCESSGGMIGKIGNVDGSEGSYMHSVIHVVHVVDRDTDERGLGLFPMAGVNALMWRVLFL